MTSACPTPTCPIGYVRFLPSWKNAGIVFGSNHVFEFVALESNSLYKRRKDQTGQGQTQVTSDASSDGWNVIYNTGPVASEPNPVYTWLNKVEQNSVNHYCKYRRPWSVMTAPDSQSGVRKSRNPALVACLKLVYSCSTIKHHTHLNSQCKMFLLPFPEWYDVSCALANLQLPRPSNN